MDERNENEFDDNEFDPDAQLPPLEPKSDEAWSTSPEPGPYEPYPFATPPADIPVEPDDYEPLPPRPPRPDSGSRGRARARQAQRKKIQNQIEKTTARASIPRQIKPAGQFEMPKIRISLNRAAIGVIGAVVFVILIVYILGRLRNDSGATHPNAVWLGLEWTHEARDPVEIATLANLMREREIGTIYAWVSWLQPELTWSAEDKFANIPTFIEQFKATYPDVQIYGWVGVPTETAVGSGVTRIDTPEIQQQVAEFSQRVVEEFGFDGVFINAEPVWDGDQSFLALLRAVRAAVGLETPIGTALPPDWSPANPTIPVSLSFASGTEWQKTYKQSVALLVDQMAVMAYHSGLTNAADYSQWTAYQVATYAEAVAELQTNTQLMIGIPTFDAEPPGHDPLVENMVSAVEGVRAGLEQAGDAAQYVSGVAIYAEWETDPEEWDAYGQMWLEN